MDVKDPKKSIRRPLKSRLMQGVGVLAASLLLGMSASAVADESPSLQELMKKAGAGDPSAMIVLGLRYDYGEKGARHDLPQAISWYKKAASMGNPPAMMLLSERYEIGRGVPMDDKKALHWLSRAARLGYPPAEDALGDRYAGGQGVAKNDGAAVRWYLRAASHGYGESQDLLGERYEIGLGLPKDPSKAFYWYLRAAKDSGNPDAFYRLGVFSETGLGGAKRSAVEACFWYSLAQQTSLSARKAIERLEPHLSDREKALAREKKTKFLARYKRRWTRWILRP